jgi:hypothetical protein
MCRLLTVKPPRGVAVGNIGPFDAQFTGQGALLPLCEQRRLIAFEHGGNLLQVPNTGN